MWCHRSFDWLPYIYIYLPTDLGGVARRVGREQREALEAGIYDGSIQKLIRTLICISSLMLLVAEVMEYLPQNNKGVYFVRLLLHELVICFLLAAGESTLATCSCHPRAPACVLTPHAPVRRYGVSLPLGDDPGAQSLSETQIGAHDRARRLFSSSPPLCPHRSSF